MPILKIPIAIPKQKCIPNDNNKYKFGLYVYNFGNNPYTGKSNGCKISALLDKILINMSYIISGSNKSNPHPSAIANILWIQYFLFPSLEIINRRKLFLYSST